MGKKKTSGVKYKSEEEVYEDLQRLMQVWKKNRTQNLFSNRSYLSSIKMDFRSSRICEIVFENPYIFNLEKEIKYMPMELMTEEFLIKMVYDKPKLLCSEDEDGPRTITIPEEKETIAVLVAFELGKRRYERNSAMQWGRYGEKIPYTAKTLEFRKTIIGLADNVEERMRAKALKNSVAFNDEEGRKEFISELVDSIQKEVTSDSIQPDEHYQPKYTNFEYGADKKMLILVSGYSDSGKTTFSNYLASRINGAICFDSDQLYERDLLSLKLSQLIRPENNVVVFSDLDAVGFFTDKEIEDAMGDANILKVYIKPSSAKRMLQHSKYRQRSRD